jgi:hypothetical protein
MEPPRDWKRPASFNLKIIEDEKFKGFTYEVNDEGYLYINSYSNIYQTSHLSFPHLTPVYMDKEVVAIAIQNDAKTNIEKMGLIYPDGKAVKGFEFNFKDIKPIKLSNKKLGTHFLVQKLNSDDLNYHIANSKGVIISESILPNLDYLKNFHLIQNSTPYYQPISTLGYALNSGKLIDLYKLKEVKISNENLYFSYLRYVVTEEITSFETEELRKNAILFVIVREENGFEYYMDLSGKKFKVPQ